MINKEVTIELSVKDMDDDNRTFKGYGNTFNFEDLVGDITQPGAFKQSLKDHMAKGTQPAMLLHHDPHRPIGVWEVIREDEKGLYVEGRLTKGVRDADEAYALMKDGALHSMSIGYRVDDEQYDSKTGINYLKAVNLREISLVTMPCNEESRVVGVKSEDGSLNPRVIEKALRDAGLSRKEAKAVIAHGLSPLCDAEDETEMAKQAEEQSMLKQILSKLESKGI